MGCCGDKRNKALPNRSDRSYPAGPPQKKESAKPEERSYLQYTGSTSLTAKGIITGAIYYFNKPGAVLDVDRRDAGFMAGIPHLRKVQKPVT